MEAGIRAKLEAEGNELREKQAAWIHKEKDEKTESLEHVMAQLTEKETQLLVSCANSTD